MVTLSRTARGSRRRTRVRIVHFAAIAWVVILSVAAVRPATGATFTGDVHSDNVSLESQLDLGHAGEMAFWGNRAVVALGGDINNPANDGFALVDITNPAQPREISRFMCNSSSFDIAIWEDLVFLAARENVQGTSCDADQVEICESSKSCFAGVRIVSIKNPRKPQQIATVSMVNPEQGDILGPEYITPLPDLVNDRILLYASGTGPPVIINVPLANPATATQLNTTNSVPASTDCYDVSFYLPGDLAACAGFTETVIWDVTRRENPVLLSQIVNPLMDHQIHAAFSWDGDTLIIADEGLSNYASDTCDGGTTSPRGALWFYDISDPKVPLYKGYFQIPQESGKFCSVQNFTVVPVPGRDILTAGWYTAGTTIVDFTDVSQTNSAKQIGFYQGPWASDANRSNVVTAYWYNGHIYAPNIDFDSVTTDRSLDVLAINDAIFDAALQLPYYNFGLQEETKGLTPP